VAVCQGLTVGGSNPVPEARELLHTNLHEVFAERDPERRWAAIGRTYTEDVTFTDPDGEFVGWQALNERAQKLLNGASVGDVFEEEGPRYAVADPATLAWRFGPPGQPLPLATCHGRARRLLRDTAMTTRPSDGDDE
jgi:hypothetical protein